MMIVSLSSLGQSYPKKVVLNNDTVWVFSPAQTLKMVEITLERNSLLDLKDSLQLDLSRCEFGSLKKTEQIGLLSQKNVLFSDYMVSQIQKTKDLENLQRKTSNQFKLYKGLTLVVGGAILTLFLLK